MVLCERLVFRFSGLRHVRSVQTNLGLRRGSTNSNLKRPTSTPTQRSARCVQPAAAFSRAATRENTRGQSTERLGCRVDRRPILVKPLQTAAASCERLVVNFLARSNSLFTYPHIQASRTHADTGSQVGAGGHS